MSKPKYKIGDAVTIDTGWDRRVLRTITISEVSANHGAKGAHRYWGTDEYRHPHGFYEDEVRQGDHPDADQAVNDRLAAEARAAKATAERDAARAEVDRLSREHSQALADRDRAFRTEVERLMKELGETITQRDELREAIDRESTAVERLTRERDRAQDGLLAVSQERNRIERETVEAIAKALEDYKFDSAEFVRDGHWKNADYWRTR